MITNHCTIKYNYCTFLLSVFFQPWILSVLSSHPAPDEQPQVLLEPAVSVLPVSLCLSPSQGAFLLVFLDSGFQSTRRQQEELAGKHGLTETGTIFFLSNATNTSCAHVTLVKLDLPWHCGVCAPLIVRERETEADGQTVVTAFGHSGRQRWRATFHHGQDRGQRGGGASTAQVQLRKRRRRRGRHGQRHLRHSARRTGRAGGVRLVIKRSPAANNLLPLYCTRTLTYSVMEKSFPFILIFTHILHTRKKIISTYVLHSEYFPASFSYLLFIPARGV